MTSVAALTPTFFIASLAPALSVAEALHQGARFAFPKSANAVRVTIAGKSAVILKADTDTLRGVGVADQVEFGVVKNDAKGHPVLKSFQTLADTARRQRQRLLDDDGLWLDT